ncbi:MAG: 50S ribosomal protein L23, partial [Gammaproteobacteria bacterium]|nr:50S ribosomal protein L23 [Gammaproteobacteria bacterium]
MREEYLYKVIKAPHSSEKSVRVAEKHRQYVFRVLPQATKKDVKAAIEKIFDVKVTAVSSMNLKLRKVRNMRTGKWMTKSGYKKV